MSRHNGNPRTVALRAQVLEFMRAFRSPVGFPREVLDVLLDDLLVSVDTVPFESGPRRISRPEKTRGDENVIETNGNLRVRIEHDITPGEPYNDGSSPLLRWGMRGGRLSLRQAACTSYRVDEKIFEAARRWGFDETFQRYLRIFQGVTQIVEYEADGISYITFDPTDWREAMGLTDAYLTKHPDVRGTMVSLDEWRAYCEGEVYGWVVERRVTWKREDDPAQTMETWVVDSSRWGYYGASEFLTEEARAGLADAVESPQPPMVPETGGR